MLFKAQASANLAFIKYMGKSCDVENTPINPSLSWTLNHLVSTVQLELREESQQIDIYLNPEAQNQNSSIEKKSISFQNKISPTAQRRFLKHLEYLKGQFDLKQSFIIRSQNNFPSDAGLASSASSFAALTKAFAKALKKLKNQHLNPIQCAVLSRRGSGSSCRSFLPGCLWMPSGQLFPITFPKWIHIVVLVSKEKKSIPSSKAHKIVLTSPLYKSRPQRAKKHLSYFLKGLEHKDWKQLYRTTQAEFHDMMDLFHTSSPSFSYLTKNTITVLNIINKLWSENNDGPLVTMDAGPHVHLIWRQDQKHLMLKSKKLGLDEFPILASPCYQEISRSTL